MENKSFRATNPRATNFSAREENILINLVKKYKNEVECKKSDTDNNRMKAEAWQKIYLEYNSILGDPHRSAKVLKNKYENIKKRAKQKFADNKKYVIGTGGGPFKDLVIADTESDLHEILGTQLTGLTSKFDSDATAESIIIQVEGNNLSDTENFNDIEENPPKKMRKSDISHSASSSLDIYPTFDSTQVDSQGFRASAKNEKSLITRFQAGHLDPENLAAPSNFCAPVEEVSRSKSSTNDWATYTPAMLKKPLSAPLQNFENNEVTPKKRSQCRQLSVKLEEWAKSKSNYTEIQEKAFIEKHEIIMKHLQEKHQHEMMISEKESQARMKFLEKEHDLKIKILEKEYASK